MKYSINKQALYLFVSILCANIVSAANTLDQVLRPLGGINLGATYLRYSSFIDAILFIILFMGLAKAAFVNRGEEFNKVSTILGIILGIAMAVFEYRTGFNMSKIAFLPALIFLGILFFLMYNLFEKSFEDKIIAFALSYLIFYGILTTAFSVVLVWINTAIPLLSALLALALLASVIMLVVRIISKFKEMGQKSTTDTTSNKQYNYTDPQNTTTPINPITPGSGGPRPPGPKPSPTPKARHPTDPPTDPDSVSPGIPSGPIPQPSVPNAPVRPKIPDEKVVFIDLSPYFNPIRSQNGLGACTAFASTAVFEYLLVNIYGRPKKYLSTLYQYYKSREIDGSIGTDRGSYNTTAALVLQNNGACFEEIWTFENKSTGKWTKHPPAIADSDASTKKLVQALCVDMNDPDQFVYALSEKSPLLIAVEWPKDIPHTASFYHNPSPGTRGRHAVVIVGYHSHYPYTTSDGKTTGIKAFKIRNSWDVTWGENGYIWMSAETLKKILIQDPIIFKGQKVEEVAGVFSIIGRSVIDNNTIQPELTGAKMFESNNFPDLIPNPENPYYVGAMAQIGGKLKVLQEVNIKDKSGKFALEFRATPSEFERLTALKSDFPKQFSQINFSQIPEGIVVYKRHSKDGPDKDWYFHIVDFKYSFGGRGGEGARDTNNPASHFNNKSLNYSGIPIVLNKQHTREVNVIIPIFDYSKHR